MDKPTKVNEYIIKHDQWSKGLNQLRTLLNNSELEEDIKWGMPTYTLGGKNVIGLAGFKHHYGLWFHNGSFLRDELGILENAQEGKTKGMRHIKFKINSKIDIDLISAYIAEAIQNQKEGKEIKVERRTKSALPISELLKAHLSAKAVQVLGSLSIGKRNEYIKYIESAKQQKTKLNRIEKAELLLNKGMGLNDMYKKT